MPKKTNIDGIRRGATQVAALILLILYISASTSIDLLHAVLHDDEVATIDHTEKQEQDPCHRLIYHFDKEHGCDDDSHLISTDKCQMCDIAFHGDQNVVPDLVFSDHAFSNSHFAFYKQDLDSHCAVIASSRAPPLVM